MRYPKLLVVAALLAAPLAANDIVFLQGLVELADGQAPNRAVEIRLQCPGKDPSRQTMTAKTGKFFLKVERDDFNHVLRFLSATTIEYNDGSVATAACAIQAVAPGFESSTINLSTFVIGKDLKLPTLKLTPKPAK